ncbi:MAG TPA: carboxypeptidase regulatory-like domain-containing protein [Vicinamibacterales bacterium]
MTRSILLIALIAGFSGTPQTPTPKPADAKPAPAAQSAPGVKPGSIDLTVTSQTGALLSGASVRADGPSSRQGSTDVEGDVILTNVAAGTYRCRIQRDGYITLEKELTVKVGARAVAEAVLSPAPPAPPSPAPAPPPPTTAAQPVLVAGLPVAVSLVDQLADDLIKSKDAVAEHDLGCSGATSAKLIRLHDGLPSQTQADADEMLYVIAGDATLTIGGKDQVVGPGWLGIIPRGTNHALARRGNKTLLVLSIQSGPVCPSPAAGAK